MFQVINRAGRGGEMEHRVDCAINKNVMSNVMIDEAEVGVTRQMRDIAGISSNQVIYSNDCVTFGQKAITEM